MERKQLTQLQSEMTQGSANVFADLGLAEASQMLAKAKLAKAIHDAILQQNLSQAEAAARAGLDQPKISKIVRGQLQEFSTERLMNILMSLGFNLEIRLERNVGETPATGAISVSYP